MDKVALWEPAYSGAKRVRRTHASLLFLLVPSAPIPYGMPKYQQQSAGELGKSIYDSWILAADQIYQT